MIRKSPLSIKGCFATLFTTLVDLVETLADVEGRTDQRNAQINFSLIDLLLFKLLRHVSATQLEPSSGSLKSLQVTCWSNLNNNKSINEKLICAFRWSVLPSIMKMHGPKNKITSWCLFIIKPTRWTSFPNLLLHETLHVSGVYSCTLGTGICHTGLKTVFKQDQVPARKLSSNLYDVYQCRVYSE